MEHIELLKQNIKNSDLSINDKAALIKILSKDDVDLDVFVKQFLIVCKVSKEVLKLFDIDIGD